MNPSTHRTHRLRAGWAVVVVLAAAGCVTTPVRDPRVSRAQAYERVGSWPEAAVVWTEIYLASEARDLDAGFYAARASFAAGRHLEARIRLVDLEARAPKDARVFELSGQVNEALGATDEALAHYRTALELDPDRPKSMTGLGALEVAAGEVEAGMARLEQGLLLDPTDGRAHYALGMAAANAGQRDKAITALSVACASEMVTDQERLDAARAVGADAAVVKWLAPVVAGDPQWTEAIWRLGEARTAAGRPGPGLELLERAAETDPGDVPALVAYARGLLRAGRIDDAQWIVEHARKLVLTPDEELAIGALESTIEAEAPPDDSEDATQG